MGQKINPIELRVGIIHDWEAKRYAEKDFVSPSHEDLKTRRFIDNGLKEASVSHVETERAANRINIAIHAGKPGMVISRGGSEIEKLRNKLNVLTDKKVHINTIKIKKVDPDVRLVVENIARQLESRALFRRVQKQAITRAMKPGAKGIKTQASGRLGGADITRAEQYSEGTAPLHMLRADIDYAHAEADTIYGELGVKIWICHREILPTKNTSGGGK